MANEQKKFWVLTLLITVAVGVFYIATIRRGVSWHSDHVIYLADAANIAEGRPYGSNGPRYIARPDISKYLFSGPQSYPPVYPLLIAPIYKVFGPNLYPMQVQTIIFFLFFLVMYAVVLKDELSALLSTLALVVVGFNPYIWSFKEDVQSDLPFLFFCFFALYVMSRALEDNEATRRNKFVYGLIVGVLIYVCYGTRTAGITLVPAFIVADAFKHKRPSALSIVATVVAILLALAQGALIKSGNGAGTAVAAGGGAYMDAATTGIDFKTAAYHMFHYPDELIRLFFGTTTRGATLIAGLPAFSIVAIGFIKKLRRGITPLETFFVFYGGLIVLFPYYGAPRLLLPIAPLFIFYLILGLKDLSPLRQRGLSTLAILLFTVIILGAYAKDFLRFDLTAPIRGAYSDTAQELFAFINKETAPDEKIIFVKPREMRFFTGRLASSYIRPKDTEELRKYINDLGATIIVADKFYRHNNYYENYLPGFVEKYNDKATQIFKNEEFTAYRWNDAS